MKSVTVIVATYRREAQLKKALYSLAHQNYCDFEIVLVDDNGEKEWNAKVLAIVDEFRNNFSQIVLNYIVNDTNRGSAKTRNIGIEAAKGEYITFLDDDDIYLPNKVSRQVLFMKSGGYDYSITDLYLSNERDVLIDKRIRSYIKNGDVDSLRMYHLKYHMTGTDTIMLKKEYLLSIGGFDPIDVGDEFYLMQKAIEGGGKFGYLPGCDVKAYVHSKISGLSSGEGKIKGENLLYEYKKSFFDKLDWKTKRYIRMRHYAVISFAEFRRKRLFSCLVNLSKAFFSSPIGCIKMIFLKT